MSFVLWFMVFFGHVGCLLPMDGTGLRANSDILSNLDIIIYSTWTCPFKTFDLGILNLRLRGGIQGWADFQTSREPSKKTKRQIRVEKGRLIKGMKKKFKLSSKKKEKQQQKLLMRHRTAEAAPASAEPDRRAAMRGAASGRTSSHERLQTRSERRNPARSSPAKSIDATRSNTSAKQASLAWTASEEDSSLDIRDRQGKRVPVHPDKGLPWTKGAKSGISSKIGSNRIPCDYV